jgi:intein/homing endonuclease
MIDFRKLPRMFEAFFKVQDRYRQYAYVPFVVNSAQADFLELCAQAQDQRALVWIIAIKPRRVGLSRINSGIGTAMAFHIPGMEGIVMAQLGGTLGKIMTSYHMMAKGLPVPSRAELAGSAQGGRQIGVLRIGRRGHESRIAGAKALATGEGRGDAALFLQLCLAADTQIIVANGDTLPISEVRAGMEIRTHTGLRALVRAVTRQPEERSTVRIRTWLNADTINPTTDHKVFTSRGWVLAGDLTPQDEIGVPIPRGDNSAGPLDLASARQPLKGKGLVQGSIPLDREFGFFVGHYLAEGWMQNHHPQYGPSMPNRIGLACHIGERAFAERSIKAIARFCKSASLRETNQKIVVSINGGSLAQIIAREFGRTDAKRIPDWVFDAPLEFRIGLILGYVAGDGSKKVQDGPVYESPMITVVSVRKRLLVQLRRLLTQVGWGYAGLHARSNKPDPRGWKCKPSYALLICADPARRIRAEFAGQVFDRVRRPVTERSSRAVKYRMDEGMVWVRIRSLERSEIYQPVYDLEVDHPDHSFDTIIGAVSNTEAAHYPPQSPFTAILPLVPRTMESFVGIESTPSPDRRGIAFRETWDNARWIHEKRRDTLFIRYFCPWMKDPYAFDATVRRDPSLIKDAPADEEERTLMRTGVGIDQIAWRRQEIRGRYRGKRELFEQENPSDPLSCFSQTEMPAFSLEERTWARQTVITPPPIVGMLEANAKGDFPIVIRHA